jgi:hypothetical protein
MLSGVLTEAAHGKLALVGGSPAASSLLSSCNTDGQETARTMDVSGPGSRAVRPDAVSVAV